MKRTLHEMLRDRSIPQAQILDEINALIDEAGLPEDLKLSRVESLCDVGRESRP